MLHNSEKKREHCLAPKKQQFRIKNRNENENGNGVIIVKIIWK